MLSYTSLARLLTPTALEPAFPKSTSSPTSPSSAALTIPTPVLSRTREPRMSRINTADPCPAGKGKRFSRGVGDGKATLQRSYSFPICTVLKLNRLEGMEWERGEWRETIDWPRTVKTKVLGCASCESGCWGCGCEGATAPSSSLPASACPQAPGARYASSLLQIHLQASISFISATAPFGLWYKTNPAACNTRYSHNAKTPKLHKLYANIVSFGTTFPISTA